MIRFVTLDEEGVYVVAVGKALSPPEEPHIVIEDLVPLRVLQNCYVVDGVLTLRPEPVGMLNPTKDTYSFVACPPKTSIIITDIAGDEIISDIFTRNIPTDHTFTLEDRGLYQIEVIPPLPQRQAIYTVEVL